VVLPRNFLEGVSETTKNLIQDNNWLLYSSGTVLRHQMSQLHQHLKTDGCVVYMSATTTDESWVHAKSEERNTLKHEHIIRVTDVNIE
jgi:hypothetical protein